MNDFDLLTDNQVNGVSTLKIFNKIGTKCSPTDYAILLGCYVSKNPKLSDRTSIWMTKTPASNDSVVGISSEGFLGTANIKERYIGIRPIAHVNIDSNSLTYRNGIYTFNYGELPRNIDNYNGELEKAYNKGILRTSGKKYTADSIEGSNTKSNFSPREFKEYLFNGEKYIRFLGDSNCEGEILSNGTIIEMNKP